MQSKIHFTLVLLSFFFLLLFDGYYRPVEAAVDLDGDGVTDKLDNCKIVPNGPLLGTCLAGDCDGRICWNHEECCGGFCSTDQEDGDGDGVGDVCDPDIEDDGVSNEFDNCPFHANGPNLGTCISGRVGIHCTSDLDCFISKQPGDCSLDQEDQDGDGVGDVCDRNYNYVIVTTNQIKDSSTELENFAGHKVSRGFSVKIVTENDFNSVTGPYPNRRAEKIRQWLIDNYQEMGIEYVLLVGNPDPDDPMYTNDIGDEINDPYYDADDYIPMKQVWHDLPRGVTHWGDATDWYYADLTGNWDADGDGFFGESPWVRQSEIPFSDLYGLDVSGFSVRWTKTFNVKTETQYKFMLKQWQGARLSVNGVVILDHWPQTRRESEREAEITLRPGGHQIVIEYYQNSGHGHVRALMKLQDADYQYFTARGEYFKNTELIGPPAFEIDSEEINKMWETTDYSEDTTINEFNLVGGVDLNAEIRVGRIPVYDNDYGTLDRILRRTIDYENTAYHPSRRRILLPMKTMRSDVNVLLDRTYTLGEAITTQVAEPQGFSTYRIYDRDDYAGLIRPPESTPCNEKNVREAYNLREFDKPGFGVVTWATHGGYRDAADVLGTYYRLSQWSDWGTPYWYYPELLTDVTPFVFMASCHNGNIYLPDCYSDTTQSDPDFKRCDPDFDRNQADGRISLGYGMLRDAAVATVSASEVSSTMAGAEFQSGMHDQYYSGLINETFAYLFTHELVNKYSAAGDALKNIKYTHFGTAGDPYTTYHEQLIFNLYGDPSLKLLRPEIFDFNGDHAVGREDLDVFTPNFGAVDCQTGVSCTGDVDDDGDIDAIDLSVFLLLYGAVE